jgi:hypothetical protein
MNEDRKYYAGSQACRRFKYFVESAPTRRTNSWPTEGETTLDLARRDYKASIQKPVLRENSTLKVNEFDIKIDEFLSL